MNYKMPNMPSKKAWKKVGSFTFAKYIKKENKAKVNVPTEPGNKNYLKK